MKHISNILMVAVFAVFAGSMYLLFFERPWLSYKNNPFPPTVQNIRAGETIPMLVIRCSSSNIPRTYRFSHSLMNDSSPTALPVVLPDSVVSIEPGCHEAISAANRVPKGTAPGIYHILGLVEIQMTLGTAFVEFYSQPFEVVP